MNHDLRKTQHGYESDGHEKRRGQRNRGAETGQAFTEKGKEPEDQQGDDAGILCQRCRFFLHGFDCTGMNLKMMDAEGWKYNPSEITSLYSPATKTAAVPGRIRAPDPAVLLFHAILLD